MIRGHCECGSVQYQVDGRITDLSHCHCSKCRQIHGAAFASFGEVAEADFTFVSGETGISTYASSDIGTRAFCSNCGSHIFAKLTIEPRNIYLAMGTVDGDPDCPSDYHIFIGSKAPWHTHRDQSPRYETLPDEDQE